MRGSQCNAARKTLDKLGSASQRGDREGCWLSPNALYQNDCYFLLHIYLHRTKDPGNLFITLPESVRARVLPGSRTLAPVSHCGQLELALCHANRTHGHCAKDLLWQVARTPRILYTADIYGLNCFAQAHTDDKIHVGLNSSGFSPSSS